MTPREIESEALAIARSLAGKNASSGVVDQGVRRICWLARKARGQVFGLSPAVAALRETALRIVVADDLSRRKGGAGVDAEHLQLARVVFALTASYDPTVQAAIGEAIAVAEAGGGR